MGANQCSNVWELMDKVSLFLRYSHVLLIGLAHGVILLPVLLSLLGPQGQLLASHAVVQQMSPDGKAGRTLLEI